MAAGGGYGGWRGCSGCPVCGGWGFGGLTGVARNAVVRRLRPAAPRSRLRVHLPSRLAQVAKPPSGLRHTLSPSLPSLGLEYPTLLLLPRATATAGEPDQARGPGALLPHYLQRQAAVRGHGGALRPHQDQRPQVEELTAQGCGKRLAAGPQSAVKPGMHVGDSVAAMRDRRMLRGQVLHKALAQERQHIDGGGVYAAGAPSDRGVEATA